MWIFVVGINDSHEVHVFLKTFMCNVATFCEGIKAVPNVEGSYVYMSAGYPWYRWGVFDYCCSVRYVSCPGHLNNVYSLLSSKGFDYGEIVEE
jgi:hypothetical protein